MDHTLEELQFFGTLDILRESICIPKHSPKTFYLITLTLIFPLSFAILAYSFFTHPLISLLEKDPYQTPHEWTLLLFYFFCYLILLFTFSLLSTAAVVFTVSCLYTSKPVSFSSTIYAIPRVFKRLFITFLWVTLLIFLYYAMFLVFPVALILVIHFYNTLLVLSSLAVICLLAAVVHVYVTALWHLATVVSVLEPVYGFAAMKKSYELLRGRIGVAAYLVCGYLAICGVVGGIFGLVVVLGGERSYGVFTRVLVGGVLVGVLVIINLVGLLVQSVVYYVCKSYHHEINKTALYEHLGGYLGEYIVPLKSSIEMGNLDG